MSNVDDDIDKELYAFFYSATDEQELVHDIQRSVDKAKQAITTLLDQKVKEARVEEHQYIKWSPSELKFIENQADRLNKLTKENKDVSRQRSNT